MDIRHDPDRGRFELDLEAGTAFLAYERAGDVLDLVSTWVPPQARHRGIGEAIVVHVLAYARDHDLEVIPTCPFIPDIIDRNPDFRGLVVAP